MYEAYGPEARMVRLTTLIEFLESMPDDLAQVVINKRMPQEESITIVGDWFAAESVAATIGEGYRQTIFTRHAPSMQGKIDLFDREFEQLLKKSKWTAASSRVAAIKSLKKLISQTRNENENKAT
jgi:hypothetical protein